jgi:hypothetical protein
MLAGAPCIAGAARAISHLTPATPQKLYDGAKTRIGFPSRKANAFSMLRG